MQVYLLSTQNVSKNNLCIKISIHFMVKSVKQFYDLWTFPNTIAGIACIINNFEV